MQELPVAVSARQNSTRLGRSGSGAEQSRKEVTRRFTAVFYGMALKSMMKTIPGRQQASAMGAAGWQFMGRYLPKELARTPGTGVVSYIRNSLHAQEGGQVNVCM